MDLVIHPFFDARSRSFSYVAANPATGRCAVVDPVLEVEPATGAVTARGVDRIIELIGANGYCVEWILETHVHGDRPSAARYLKDRFLCAQTAIGAGAARLRQSLDPGREAAGAGAQGFDRLFEDGERVRIGHASGWVLATPGHTPSCVSYVFGGCAFVGDVLGMPDVGTGRCDLPGGDARALFRSVQQLYRLPDETRLCTAHDHPPGQRAPRFWATVGEHKRNNCLLRSDTGEQAFVTAREARDRALEGAGWCASVHRANAAGGALPGELAKALRTREGAGFFALSARGLPGVIDGPRVAAPAQETP